jgi:hypothetical protein
MSDLRSATNNYQMHLIYMNLVTPLSAAKREFLFNKPASGQNQKDDNLKKECHTKNCFYHIYNKKALRVDCPKWQS